MSEENLAYFTGPTRLDIPAQRVLDNAPENMESVVLVGYDEGGEFYFASSVADGADALWLLAMAQKKLLEIGDP